MNNTTKNEYKKHNGNIAKLITINISFSVVFIIIESNMIKNTDM